MGPTDDMLRRLDDGLGEAALDPSRWGAVLAQASGLVGGDGAICCRATAGRPASRSGRRRQNPRAESLFGAAFRIGDGGLRIADPRARDEVAALVEALRRRRPPRSWCLGATAAP